MLGVFDSCVGGLTVARELQKQLPEYDLIYFGDTARSPYGNKSKETIVRYALEDADFLIRRGAKAIVIACNTASALALGALKEKYPDMPIFEVITPAVDEAIAVTKTKRIGVIGTRATIKSGIYEAALKKKGNSTFVISSACPLFVPLIEEGWINQPEIKTIARKYLLPFRNCNIDTLILGCTHYPIIKNLIQARVGRRVKLVDSASAVAQRVKEFLSSHPDLEKEMQKNKKQKFFVSDLTEQCRSVANKFLAKNITIYESGDFK